MPGLKLRIVDAEQKMEDRIEYPAGLLRREISRRFNGDHDEPENQGNPGFQDMIAITAQTSRIPWGDLIGSFVQFPSLGCICGRNLSTKRPVLYTSLLARDDSRSLFDGIVGGFAGDHDVVHMAFAQAGATDADETRLLQ